MTNYKLDVKTMGEDVWNIHYLRVNETTVRISCDLLRPNRRFWQSKYLWSDFTYCSAKNINLIKCFADDIINEYYHQKASIKKINEFFEIPIDNSL